jgi:glycine/serine hydroxymethyltransferase
LYLDVDAEGMITAGADYVPEAGQPADVTLILALYDDRGRLIESKRTAGDHLTVGTQKGTAAAAKVFLWETDTFVPVMPAKALDLS